MQRGPLVYCAEAADNNGSVSSLSITGNPLFGERFEKGILQGVVLLDVKSGNSKMTLIPYYAWANREVGAMKVWFPVQ